MASPAELLAHWRVAPAPALLLATASALYWIGVQRLRARGRRWRPARSAAFGAGIAIAIVATQSGIALSDARFDVHVVEHVLLGLAVPLLLALGAPVTLALQATSRRAQLRILTVVRSGPVRVVSHPVVAALLFGLTMFALYFSPVYRWSTESSLVHEAVHLHFIAIGALLFWVTIGIDPVAWRVPFAARFALVLLTVPFHAFLGLALLSTAAPIAPRVSVAAQHRGAAIMWVVGDVIGFVAGGVVLAQWMRHEERRAVRVDRRLDLQERALAAHLPGPATVR